MITDGIKMNEEERYVTVNEHKYKIEGKKLVIYQNYMEDITEIKGLENLSDLEELTIVYSRISEIKGLNHLINLKQLNLYHNFISELKGLEDLTNLTDIQLQENRIKELKGLDTLTNLTSLYLFKNQIPEIKGLESLKNLRHLNLHSNRITVIKGLDALKNLDTLNLANNYIKEIQGLEDLAQLTQLSLHENQISEIKGIYHLVNLNYLTLSSNPLKENELELTRAAPPKMVDFCQIKEILQFEYENQRQIERWDLIKKFKMKSERIEYFSTLLDTIIVEYNPDEMQKIESLVHRSADKLEKNQLSLYTFVVLLGFDLETAKKIGFYLINTGVFKEFPRFPDKKFTMPMDRQMFPESRKTEKSYHSQLLLYEGPEPFSFIAYKRTDGDQVYPILKKLQDDGFRMWFDKGILGGTDYMKVLMGQIKKCSSMLAFISHQLSNSEDTINEILNAKELKKKVICIYLEKMTIPSDLPEKLQYKRIQDDQYIEMFNKTEKKFYEELKETLRKSFLLYST